MANGSEFAGQIGVPSSDPPELGEQELAAVEKRENYLPTQAVGQRDSKLGSGLF